MSASARGVERFNAKFGANIEKSIGAAADAPHGAGGPLPGAVHGVPPATPGRHDGVIRPRDALIIPVDRLRPDPAQPRKGFDEGELARLADSLRARGQLQPIRVRWDDGQGGGGGAPGWVIVSGERRWRAARLAGLDTLAAVEAKGAPTPAEVKIDQLVENCVREDLRPIEQAVAFKELMDGGGYSGRQLAQLLNVSHVSVQRALGLLDLPGAIRDQVERGELPASTAIEVSRAGDVATQVELAREVVGGKIARSDVKDIVRAVREGKAKQRPAPAARPAPVAIDLGDGCTVTVRWRKPGGPTLEQALRKALRAAREREGAKADAEDERAA